MSCPAYHFHLAAIYLVSQPHERRFRALLPQVEVEMLWKAKEEGLARYGTCVDSNSISSHARSILCDTRKHQAPLSLSRQRSCARHPTRKTLSRQARQTDIRPHGRSYRAQPSIHSSSSHSPLRHAILHVSALLANRYICTYLPPS